MTTRFTLKLALLVLIALTLLVGGFPTDEAPEAVARAGPMEPVFTAGEIDEATNYYQDLWEQEEREAFYGQFEEADDGYDLNSATAPEEERADQPELVPSAEGALPNL